LYVPSSFSDQAEEVDRVVLFYVIQFGNHRIVSSSPSQADTSLTVWVFHMFVHGFGNYTVFVQYQWVSWWFFFEGVIRVPVQVGLSSRVKQRSALMTTVGILCRKSLADAQQELAVCGYHDQFIVSRCHDSELYTDR
jgi:hypothetical protein